MPLDPISTVLGIGKIGLGIFQNIKANEIDPQYHAYETSPYAKQQLATAQQLYNGRMFGASDLERNIASSQANYLNNVGRNATDSSQALALGGLSQGVSNNAYNNLQIQEGQNKYNLLNNLNAGYAAMVNEGDKTYADQMQKYMIDTQQQASLRGAAFGNIFGAGSDIASQNIMSNQWNDLMGGGGQGGYGLNGGAVDMNSITGGINGNRSILQGGNPFIPHDNSTPYNDYMNPYGTNTRLPFGATQLPHN